MDRSYSLTAFEAYMLADDAPVHPMTALFEAEYSGRLDRDRFEAAIAYSLSEHPLLRSLIDRTGRRTRWMPRHGVAPFLSWAAEEAALRFPGDSEYIDLTREIGLRVWVRAGVTSGRVVFQLHHACTDGVGVTNFVLDVFRAYANLAEFDHDVSPRPVRDERLLANRDRFFRRPVVGRVKMLAGAVFASRRWRRSRPIPLVESPTGTAMSPRPLAAIRSRSLDPHELDGLLDAAHGADATLNDVLLRDLFLVLADRCRDRDAHPDECLCLCMPFNLRDPSDGAMPAANKMTMSFLRRSPGECHNAAGLLRSVHDETQLIKRTRRGLRLLEILRLALAVRGEIPQSLLRKGSFATAVLSNLGRLGGRAAGLPTDGDGRLVCGDVTIDRVVTAPNGRPGTAAVFVALTYAGHLTICLRFDPSAMTDAEADELLEAFVERLRLSAGEVREACEVG